jgi:hypothetical protein
MLASKASLAECWDATEIRNEHAWLQTRMRKTALYMLKVRHVRGAVSRMARPACVDVHDQRARTRSSYKDTCAMRVHAV